MKTIPLRLSPDQDLIKSLDALAKTRNLQAACILTCVGSLRKAVLRFADQNQATELVGKFEIVSLTGTFSVHGSHYHISISDGQGRTIGGHLLEGCLIYTTAEIVIGVLPGVRFLREMDDESGYKELAIYE
ncbi:MAG: DNA-binding protein [Anaerolineales bacterium]|nr:DNA-binding protein [Anaerolineales bacterium]